MAVIENKVVLTLSLSEVSALYKLLKDVDPSKILTVDEGNMVTDIFNAIDDLGDTTFQHVVLHGTTSEDFE